MDRCLILKTVHRNTKPHFSCVLQEKWIRGRGPSGSRSLACLVSRKLTFQLYLRGGIDTALFMSVSLVLGALGRDHRVRNELLSPWCQLWGKLLLHTVTASQPFPEGLGGATAVCPSPEVVLSC